MHLHTIILALALGTSGSGALAQHAHDSPLSAQSPYAGEQQRSIKSLSAAEQAALLDGAGMGYAKAAELNGYPGPMHVLELADGLALSAEQRNRTRALMAAHKERASRLGARLVEAERSLDAAFAHRRIDEAGLRVHTATIAGLQAELRAEHLATHLAQTTLLTPEQVATYARLRGYTATLPNQHKHHAH